MGGISRIAFVMKRHWRGGWRWRVPSPTYLARLPSTTYCLAHGGELSCISPRRADRTLDAPREHAFAPIPYAPPLYLLALALHTNHWYSGRRHRNNAYDAGGAAAHGRHLASSLCLLYSTFLSPCGTTTASRLAGLLTLSTSIAASLPHHACASPASAFYIFATPRSAPHAHAAAAVTYT